MRMTHAKSWSVEDEEKEKMNKSERIASCRLDENGSSAIDEALDARQDSKMEKYQPEFCQLPIATFMRCYYSNTC